MTSILSSSHLFNFFGILGGLVSVAFVFRLVSLLLDVFVTPGVSLARFGARKGSFAVVTGSTDGIGLEFAKQLAAKGFNLILASRNEEKLNSVKEKIQRKHKSTIIQTVAIDFSKSEKDQWENLQHVISETGNIGVLINNVGVSHSLPISFAETSLEEMQNIINVNVSATLKVTQLVLPQMLKNKKGLVLNIGSMAGLVPTPLLATYSGSKSFLSTWSQALSEELRSEGILVSLVNTYFVVSSMSKISKPSILAPTPAAYVRSVLSKIGRPGGGSLRPFTSTPFWSHAIVEWAIGLVGVCKWLLSYNHTLHQDIRKRALRKQERLSKLQ